MTQEQLKIKANLISSISHVDISLINASMYETYFIGSSRVNNLFYPLIKKDINDALKSVTPKHQSIVQFTSLWHAFYIIKPLFDTSMCTGYVVAGPILRNTLSSTDLVALFRKFKVQKTDFDDMLNLYSTIITLTDADCQSLSDLLNHVFESQLKPYHIINTIADESDIKTIDLHKGLLNFHSYIEENYRLEKILLHAVEQGDSHYLQELFRPENRAYIANRTPDNPIRSDKNLLLTLNTLCSRAGIKGGLPLSIAHNLSTSFVVTIEKTKTSSQIKALSTKLVVTYCDMVKQYKTKDVSPLISNTITYIYQNITSKLMVTELAETFFISAEHLSRKFKKEMDEGLSHFIQRIKCEEADYLMSTNLYTLTEIAEQLSFNSLSHFSTTYKKIKGHSPKHTLS